MQYLVWKGDYYQMGVERGTLLKRNAITFPLRLDRFQLEHGKRSEAILRHFFPGGLRGNQGRERSNRHRLRRSGLLAAVHGMLHV